jgi:uncharacterized membrane protein YwaF
MGILWATIQELLPLWGYYLAGIAGFFLSFFLLRKRPESAKMAWLWALCAINFIAFLVHDYYFLKRGDQLLAILPLQLCTITVFLLPFALGLKKRLLYDFLFYICAIGALMALIVPSSDKVGGTYSLFTLSFFVFHYIPVLIPLLLACWGIYRPRPTLKSVSLLSAAFFGTAAALHLLNLALNSSLGIEADYFFTIIRYSAPYNPLLAFFASLIPFDFFYLLPAALILWFYIFAISLPWNWRRWFGSGRAAAKLAETAVVEKESEMATKL